jgi:hypothetical protein
MGRIEPPITAGEQLLSEARCARTATASPAPSTHHHGGQRREWTVTASQPAALGSDPPPTEAAAPQTSTPPRLHGRPGEEAWADTTKPPPPPRYHSRSGGEKPSDGAAAPEGLYGLLQTAPARPTSSSFHRRSCKTARRRPKLQARPDLAGALSPSGRKPATPAAWPGN